MKVKDSTLLACHIQGKVEGSDLTSVKVTDSGTVIGSRMKSCVVSGRGHVENVDGEGFVVTGNAVVKNVTLPKGTKIGGTGDVQGEDDFVVLRDPAGGEGTVTVHRSYRAPYVEVQEMRMDSRWEGLDADVAAATSHLMPHPMFR